MSNNLHPIFQQAVAPLVPRQPSTELGRLHELNLNLLNALQSYVSHAEGWEAQQPLSFEAQRRLDTARAAIKAVYSDGEGK